VKLHILDLNKLHTFLTVADAGGISPAARRLALTRSAVSQAVAALERSLDVALFHRVGRRLVPTREGALLHRRFAEYQTALARTLDEVVERRGQISGVVRIGVYLGFPRPTLVRLLARLAAAHPGGRWQVLYGSQDDLRDRLIGGRLDLAFSLRPGRDARREVRSTPLFEQELVLVATRAHFRADFAVEDLARTPVVDYYRSDPLVDRWMRHHGRGRRLVAAVRAWAATTDLVLELVLAGVGVGVLPRSLVEPHLRRGRLRAIPTGRPELRDTVWLDELRSGGHSPSARAIHEAVVAEIAVGSIPPLGPQVRRARERGA
jgi:DNA-binding transcriptional LysR family regulator